MIFVSGVPKDSSNQDVDFQYKCVAVHSEGLRRGGWVSYFKCSTFGFQEFCLISHGFQPPCVTVGGGSHGVRWKILRMQASTSASTSK